jgi:hypothetical protein
LRLERLHLKAQRGWDRHPPRGLPPRTTMPVLERLRWKVGRPAREERAASGITSPLLMPWKGGTPILDAAPQFKPEARWEVGELDPLAVQAVELTSGDTLVTTMSATVSAVVTGAKASAFSETGASSVVGGPSIQPFEQEMEVFVDSGAALSIISAELVTDLQLSLLPVSDILNPNTYLRTVSGEFMAVSGRARLHFTMGDGVTVEWTCLVVPSFSQGVLLGVDFLVGTEAVMDFGENLLMLPQDGTPGAVPIITASGQKGLIAVEQPIVLGPRMRVITRAHSLQPLPAWCTPGRTVELNMTKHCKLHSGILMARSWGHWVDGAIPIRLINPHYHEIWVYPDEALGYMECAASSIKVGGVITLLNPGRNNEGRQRGLERTPITPAVPIHGIDVTQPQEADLQEALPPGRDFSTRAFENLAADESPEERRDRVRKAARAVKNEKIPSGGMDQLEEVMVSHADCFQDTPGLCTLAEMRLDTGDARPVARRPYRNALIASAGFLDQLMQWEKKGIIRRSSSAWSAPVLLVPKKNGTWRTVVDFRQLNKLLTKEENPIPRISDVLDSFHGAMFFTTLDLTSGYYQIAIAEEDCHKTAFSSQWGAWEFTKAAQGLSTSPALFQRTMELMLRGLVGVCAMCYIDDVIIYSPTFESHLSDVDQVLTRIQEAGMTVKLSKCSFFSRQVEYLGHIISDEGIKVCPDKVLAIKQFPVPSNATGVRSFLGVANFYRRFIKDFSRIARPLHALTKKGITFSWPLEAQVAFDTLKTKLVEAPVLVYPDFEKTFELNVDACDVGAGGVLVQLDDEGHPHPIAFYSAVYTSTEANYSVPERECLAMVKALRHFRPYIFGRQILVYTDHKPLQWLASISDPAGRLIRWALVIADYDIVIRHRPGVANTDADGLSRAYVFTDTSHS